MMYTAHSARTSAHSWPNCRTIRFVSIPSPNISELPVWRDAVIALHEDNIYDKQIARLPEDKRNALNRRYSSLTLQPEKMKFIDRMVADSRQVALNHTAGLSLPQQMQMKFIRFLRLAG